MTGAILTTHRYKPYGARLSGPFFGAGFFWTGNTGSRSTGRPFAEQYNRARHYSIILSQWTTCDALWPTESAYGYVRGNPNTRLDPSGEIPTGPCLKHEQAECRKACKSYSGWICYKREARVGNCTIFWTVQCICTGTYKPGGPLPKPRPKNPVPRPGRGPIVIPCEAFCDAVCTGLLSLPQIPPGLPDWICKDLCINTGKLLRLCK